jgi:hypothetical protein
MKVFKLFVLSLCLCASTSLAVFADGPRAAEPSQKAPQSTAPVQQMTAAQMAMILGIPAPVFKSTCSATNTSCPDGCPITCTGTSSCTVGSNSVTCDGVTTGCLYPSCNPGPNCHSPEQKCDFCACRAHGGTIPNCACAN